MAEDEPLPDPDFRAVAGIVLTIPPDRPDVLLVELKTLQGPLRFAMTQGIALKVAECIEEKAKLLKPDRFAH
jgi:hypothetical protein